MAASLLVGELVVNFYLERQPLPNSISHEITANGTIGKETAIEPSDIPNSLVRFVSSGDSAKPPDGKGHSCLVG